MPTDKKGKVVNTPTKESAKQSDKKSNEKKESKSETFKRLAPNRVNSVLRSLRILSNCGNRINYEYTSDEVEKIFDSISEAYQNSLAKFTKSKAEQEAFKF